MSKALPWLSVLALMVAGATIYAIVRGEQTARRVTKVENPTVGEACHLVEKAGLTCKRPQRGDASQTPNNPAPQQPGGLAPPPGADEPRKPEPEEPAPAPEPECVASVGELCLELP